jgi:biotin transporter BioY
VEAISTMQEAIVAGFAPFVIGDLLKIALAGVLLPLAWRLVRRAH